MMSRGLKASLVGFFFGAFVPLFWGVLSFLLFNIRESRLSRAYWHAVYVTCPFWVIDGGKALFLVPVLNGCLYALLAAIIVKMFGSAPANQ
jgi:hypothetical protein